MYKINRVKIDPNNILETSIKGIDTVNLFKEVKIVLSNEKVSDAGGLLREWIYLI